MIILKKSVSKEWMKWVRRPQKSMRKNDCGFKNEGKKRIFKPRYFRKNNIV